MILVNPRVGMGVTGTLLHTKHALGPEDTPIKLPPPPGKPPIPPPMTGIGIMGIIGIGGGMIGV